MGNTQSKKKNLSWHIKKDNIVLKSKYIHVYNYYIYFFFYESLYCKYSKDPITLIMKSTLKVHNPRVIICISDVQCVIYECHR